MASASEILKAYLHCARTPAEDAVERIRTQLKKQYGAAEVELTVSVEPDHLGIMLFDKIEEVGVGTLVTRSGKRAGIPVGDGFLGRVISPLGEPIDGKGPIEAEGYNPIEKQAPGILAIDSMFPIGRGQRELIIGDRQTGKTSIATDAILN